jgi:hypothetical protein
MITVSAYTEVEADTVKQAIATAAARPCELSFNGCGHSADEVWLVEEIDGEPQHITGVAEA